MSATRPCCRTCCAIWGCRCLTMRCCPGGDVAQGVILCSVFAGNAPSADAATPMIELNGGTLQINGSIELTGDVTAQGISLVTHRHGGVQSGGTTTGEPQ